MNGAGSVVHFLILLLGLELFLNIADDDEEEEAKLDICEMISSAPAALV